MTCSTCCDFVHEDWPINIRDDGQTSQVANSELGEDRGK